MSSAFPCTGCGACCKSILLSAQTKWLDRGDGTCRYFVEDQNTCGVYENRPDVCNVRTMYDRHYKFVFTWPDFVAINQKACEKLFSTGRSG
jgi:hypothetical protein